MSTTRIKTQAQDDIATLVHNRQLFVKQQVSLTNVIFGQYNRHEMRLGRTQLTSQKRLRDFDFMRFRESKQQ